MGKSQLHDYEYEFLIIGFKLTVLRAEGFFGVNCFWEKIGFKSTQINLTLQCKDSITMETFPESIF